MASASSEPGCTQTRGGTHHAPGAGRAAEGCPWHISVGTRGLKLLSVSKAETLELFLKPPSKKLGSSFRTAEKTKRRLRSGQRRFPCPPALELVTELLGMEGHERDSAIVWLCVVA